MVLKTETVKQLEESGSLFSSVEPTDFMFGTKFRYSTLGDVP